MTVIKQGIDSLNQALGDVFNLLSNINIPLQKVAEKISDLEQLEQFFPSLKEKEKQICLDMEAKFKELKDPELRERMTKLFSKARKSPLANRIPILTPSHSTNSKVRTIPYECIELDLPLKNDNFKAAVKCADQLVPATVIADSIDFNYLKDKLKNLNQEEAKDYFRNHFRMDTVGKKGKKFQIWITPKNIHSIHNAQILTEQLYLNARDGSNYLRLERLAEATIKKFAKELASFQPQELVDELAALAFTISPSITRKFLDTLITAVQEKKGLLNIDLLRALKEGLSKASSKSISSGDLVKILEITISVLDGIDTSDKTKVYPTLSAISDILDRMIDLKVEKLSRTEIHDPLYAKLEAFTKHENILVSSHALYAQQGLTRISNGESKIYTALCKAEAAIQGLANLYKTASNQDLSALKDAYQNFKEAIDSKRDKEKWYPDIRILKLFSAAGRSDGLGYLNDFKKMIDTEMENTQKDSVVGIVFSVLYDLVLYHPDPIWKKTSLDLMKELVVNIKRFGKNQKIKKQILMEMQELIQNLSFEIGRYARNILNSVPANLSRNLRKKFQDLLNKKITTLSIDPITQAKPSSTILIRKAQHSNFLSVDEKLIEMKEQILRKRERAFFAKDVSYIFAQGSCDVFHPTSKTFDLHPFIIQHLGKDDPILLLGDSGSGKSTYLRFLQQDLWQHWSNDKQIPLLITIKEPYDQVIHKAFESFGFSPRDIRDLKTIHRFIFLVDGYDESKEARNIYEQLQLKGWECQVIVACRTQHLLNDKNDYQNRFLPNPNTKLHEVAISPFNENQYNDYCREFFKLEGADLAQKYLDQINAIPDLKKMATNPFLLQLILEVLPKMLKEREEIPDNEKSHFLRIDIFEAYIKKCFEEEESRLRKQSLLKNYDDIKVRFGKIAEALALRMVKEGGTALSNEEVQKICSNPSVRSGLRLKKVDTDSYSFMHKSLMEYFLIRSIIPNSSRCTIHEENLGKNLWANDCDIIRLLTESVSKNREYQDLLFQIVEKSRGPEGNPIAAANAITILNALGVSFSGRDLSGIRIQGANLYHANLFNTNLSFANLTNVKMHGAYLVGCSLQGSILKGLDLVPQEYSNELLSDIKTYKIEGLKEVVARSYSTSIFDFPNEIKNALAMRAQEELIKNDPELSVGSGEGDHGDQLLFSKAHPKKEFTSTKASDGSRVATWDQSGIIHIWDLKPSTKKILKMKEKGASIIDLTISPDGKWLLSGTSKNQVNLWDLSSGKVVHRFKHGQMREVADIRFIDGGRYFLSGQDLNCLKLWQIRDEKGDLAPALLWSSSGVLTAQNVNLKDAIGLSDENRVVLKQLSEENRESNCVIL